MPTNEELVQAIRASPDLLGIPHSKCDCQAAVEKALGLVGVNVNYRGSNHMWREMVKGGSTIPDYIEANGELAPGLIAFTLKNDGSERKRGYYDDMGAAVHVGIILDKGDVFQSASRGTEICPLSRTTFNRVAECIHITYNRADIQHESGITEKLDYIIKLLEEVINREN